MYIVVAKHNAQSEKVVVSSGDENCEEDHAMDSSILCTSYSQNEANDMKANRCSISREYRAAKRQSFPTTTITQSIKCK